MNVHTSGVPHANVIWYMPDIKGWQKSNVSEETIYERGANLNHKFMYVVDVRDNITLMLTTEIPQGT